jgi:hypothetical protein
MLLSWAWLLQALGGAGLPGRNRSLLVRAYEYGGLRLADTWLTCDRRASRLAAYGGTGVRARVASAADVAQALDDAASFRAPTTLLSFASHVSFLGTSMAEGDLSGVPEQPPDVALIANSSLLAPPPPPPRLSALIAFGAVTLQGKTALVAAAPTGPATGVVTPGGSGATGAATGASSEPASGYSPPGLGPAMVATPFGVMLPASQVTWVNLGGAPTLLTLSDAGVSGLVSDGIISVRSASRAALQLRWLGLAGGCVVRQNPSARLQPAPLPAMPPPPALPLGNGNGSMTGGEGVASPIGHNATGGNSSSGSEESLGRQQPYAALASFAGWATGE